MKSLLTTEDDTVNLYCGRCDLRQLQLLTATMNFVEYFINLGDDQPTAESKVSQVSTECASFLYAYVLGNKAPLLESINNSTLPFMDAPAKQFLIDALT